MICQTTFPHNLQSWSLPEAPEGHALWPDDLDTAAYVAHNGFVTLTIEKVNGVDTVTSYKPDVPAWEEWKASLPEPAPEPLDPIAQMDEAIIELYELTQGVQK